MNGSRHSITIGHHLPRTSVLVYWRSPPTRVASGLVAMKGKPSPTRPFAKRQGRIQYLNTFVKHEALSERRTSFIDKKRVSGRMPLRSEDRVLFVEVDVKISDGLCIDL